MSGSWTENLEPSMELKSPEVLKSPEPKAHSSKAGKVLEDVHDRLVEDHNTVAVAPLSPSNTLSQDVASVAENDEASSIDGRNISPSPSQSSKRTSTSAELKATMRSKIRKQAEKTVERKRGSVQLAKRLQRRLTIHQEEGPTEGELKSVDEQIEHSLKIGARFLQEQKSFYPPDDIQYAFFVEDYEKEDQPPQAIGPLLNYRRAEMVNDVDPNLVYYDARPLDLEANNGSITLTRMTQRLSDKFFTDGKLRRIDESMYVKPLKIIQNDDILYNYVKAEPWETFVDEIRGSEYVQLDLYLGGILFEKHPLASEEDKIHVRLTSLYDEQCERINKMTDALMDAENAPTRLVQMLLISFAVGNRAELVHEESSTLRERANQLYGEVRSGAERLAEEYANMENCRNQQGFTTSSLMYTVDQADRENGSLLGKMTIDGPLTPVGALPAAERTRIETLKKTTLHVVLHFNDIFICKSKSVPLESFQYKFDQIYNLEIVSEPKSITATIVEKVGTTKKTLAKVNIPLPATDNNDPPPARIPFENTDNSVNGTLTARSSWSTEARTKRRESAAPVTVTNDGPFSIIPPGVRLVSDEEFDSNPRWNALERRYRKRNAVGRIPIDGSDIDVPSVRLGDDRRQKTKFRTAVDGARAIGFAHAVKLRTKLLERDQDAAELSYSEIVREEPLPGLFGAIGSLFGPADLSRKLKPMRRTPIRQQNFSPTSLNLMINLQAAVNLPTRSDGQLHTVIEVTFQNSIRCTPSVSGRNPNWQHGLSLPVNGADDPKSIIDCIKLNVYDQRDFPVPNSHDDDGDHGDAHGDHDDGGTYCDDVRDDDDEDRDDDGPRG
nr:C2 calcium-dependent membrane targeting domain containing protein [Haemonchus contortus]